MVLRKSGIGSTTPPLRLGVLTERLGPLPLVNHFIGRMGLAEILERHVPSSRGALTHAQALR